MRKNKIKSDHHIGAVPKLNGIGEGPFVKMMGVWGDDSSAITMMFRTCFGPDDPAAGYPRCEVEKIAPRMKQLYGLAASCGYPTTFQEFGLFSWPEVTISSK